MKPAVASNVRGQLLYGSPSRSPLVAARPGREACTTLMQTEIEPRNCEKCRSYYFGDEHHCVPYDGPPCQTCARQTTFVELAAPGFGSGRVCPVGHYHGTRGEVTL